MALKLLISLSAGRRGQRATSRSDSSIGKAECSEKGGLAFSKFFVWLKKHISGLYPLSCIRSPAPVALPSLNGLSWGSCCLVCTPQAKDMNEGGDEDREGRKSMTNGGE